MLVRGCGIRDIAAIENISVGTVLTSLLSFAVIIQPKQKHYDQLEVDELWTYVGKKKIKSGLFTLIAKKTRK
jgi:hypothetical protein